MSETSDKSGYEIKTQDGTKIEVATVKSRKSKSVPVMDNPTDAPFIFADSLYSLNELGGIVRLAFVRNLVVSNEEGSSLEGRHVAVLALTKKQFFKLAEYFGKVADDMRNGDASEEPADDDE